MSCTQELLKRGYRLTPQRTMVIDILHNANQHISAEEIFMELKRKYPYANVSTVYRTLELLNELGLAAVIETKEGIARYHVKEHSYHHHLICNKCGTMAELPMSELMPLEKGLVKKYGFKADLRHIAVFGVCSKCQQTADDK
jgi:Fur family transcriptional regulator, ferric uptake regulator